uniref:ATAQ protein n=1 Tax=Amblyomma variegatum TaxID=34610 RepID=E5D584_AMBVA|nr:ATAQ protein [Amblyomma variegatum]
MNSLTLIACLGFLSAVSSNPLGADDDICSTAGKLCGNVDCVLHQDPEFFTCQCGKDQYFNATAQRCYHVKSCGPYPCTVGTCQDNDGISERTCQCLNFENMSPKCFPENNFKTACGNAGGEIEPTKRGVTCRCPDGMKWEGNKCKSVACTYPRYTCTDICYNKRLLEDTRCCQGWDQASCLAVHAEDTYCKPGTISTGQDLDCINVCAADQSGCEYNCSYTDKKSPEFICLCPPDQELNMDGRTCSERKYCNDEEKKPCSAVGKECVFEEGKAKCRCHDDSIEIDGTCNTTCTAEKTKECAGMLSACKIVDSVQTCTCEQPLTWDDAKKVCVLEQQFRYAFAFKEYQYSKQDRCSKWYREDLAEVIDEAMKNLYGKELSASRLIECGEERKVVELTFKAEPLPPALNRIHQCENKGEDFCLFAPHLRIINGSVSEPTPVDLCAEFFTKIPAVKDNGLQCHKGEGGEYSLRCAQKSSKTPEKYGALTVELCSGDPNTGSAAASVSAAFLLGLLVPALVALREL